MPAYSEADLVQARRPLRDELARSEAFCTLGHLEAEQREAATSDRAAVIREIKASIATFDGVEPESEATLSAPGPLGAPASPAATVPSLVRPASVPPTAAGPSTSAGIAASRASMERTLRSQGLLSAGALKPVDLVADMKRRHGIVDGNAGPGPARGGIDVARASMDRTLRSQGITDHTRQR